MWPANKQRDTGERLNRRNFTPLLPPLPPPSLPPSLKEGTSPADRGRCTAATDLGVAAKFSLFTNNYDTNTAEERAHCRLKSDDGSYYFEGNKDLKWRDINSKIFGWSLHFLIVRISGQRTLWLLYSVRIGCSRPHTNIFSTTEISVQFGIVRKTVIVQLYQNQREIVCVL